MFENFIITNVTVVTMNSQRRIINDGFILVDGKKIVGVDSMAAAPTDIDRVDGHGLIAIPGLIDTHAHADQSLLRGLGDKLHWMPFLDDVVEPYLSKRAASDAVLANTLSMMEMLRAGTTCFVSPNVDPADDYEGLCDSIDALGIRAVLGRFITPTPGEDNQQRAASRVKDATKIMKQWHGDAQGRIHFWYGLMVPRRPGDTDHPEFYRAVSESAQAQGMGIVYHFCSEFEDAVYIQNTYGVRPAEWSRDNHALGEHVLLINGCWVTPKEIEILAETGTHLTHSPVANMKMATGILPVPDVLSAGVNLGLGTDGALNNNSYDMFAEMKTACLLQNATRRSANALSAESVLEMATINGAKAIGQERELGSIEVGKRADIVLVDMKRPNTYPVHDVVSNLVFSCNGSNVDSVFVDGRQVLTKGRLLTIDEQEVLTQAQGRAEEIRRLLKVQAPGSWVE